MTLSRRSCGIHIGCGLWTSGRGLQYTYIPSFLATQGKHTESKSIKKCGHAEDLALQSRASWFLYLSTWTNDSDLPPFPLPPR